MRAARHPSSILSILAMFLLLAPLSSRGGQRAGEKNPTTRVRIELTAGDNNKPLADASVYVRFPANPKAPNGKLIELNLKTNQQGVAESPEIPQGKVLIQVIAPGWKTYGEWFDVKQQEQTIPVHLVRPTTNWY